MLEHNHLLLQTALKCKNNRGNLLSFVGIRGVMDKRYT